MRPRFEWQDVIIIQSCQVHSVPLCGPLSGGAISIGHVRPFEMRGLAEHPLVLLLCGEKISLSSPTVFPVQFPVNSL